MRFMWALSLVAAVWCSAMEMALAEPQVPCYFIFGDSLVDNGNNNGIASLARANYAPYGIDFPDGATGRFSNGKTTTDVIGYLSIYLSVCLSIYLSIYLSIFLQPVYLSTYLYEVSLFPCLIFRIRRCAKNQLR